MKKITFFFTTFLLITLNSFSQCDPPEIYYWDMGLDYVYMDGNNNSEVDYYEIEFNEGESFTPGDGTAQAYTFNNFPHTMSGLSSGTIYYFTIRSVCNDGSVSDWTNNNPNGVDQWSTDMPQGEFLAENILSHNSSQDITHEPSQLCESTTASYDFLFSGDNVDSGLVCPETTFTTTSDGPYIITITDSYGDGWVGNAGTDPTSLDVLVNGVVVLDNITITEGFSSEYTFDANNGDEISTQWQNQGTWFYEVGYSIISQNAAADGETVMSGQIYHRSYIPADFGYEGNITIGAVELGIWYSDSDGNFDPDLPTSSYPGTQYQNLFLYKHTTGGVGTDNIGQDQANFELIAFSLNFEVTPDDHLSVINVPLTFLPGYGNLNGNGIEVSANDEFVIQVWMAPGDAASTGVSEGVRLSIGGNLSDFTISPDDTTNYPYPAVQAGTGIDPNSTCEFYTYVDDNTSLMNLVIGSNDQLSVNDLDSLNLNIFPNPINATEQFLNIKANNTYLKKIVIYDIMGRVVFDKTTENEKIDISTISSGTYILEVNINGSKKTSKLIIR